MLWERILEPGLGFCLLASAGGSPTAAIVLLTANGRMTYKYAASETRFLGLRPNHLLISEAISWGCQNGFRELDFGRSDLDNAGLRSFKSSWGATEEPLVYSSIGEAPRAVRRARAAAVLGPFIRHSPKAVCRLTGELLYKYSA
jgi:CelD/BcsL family acetyltransferase involved in cellulose biosynthesis